MGDIDDGGGMGRGIDGDVTVDGRKFGDLIGDGVDHGSVSRPMSSIDRVNFGVVIVLCECACGWLGK